MLKTIVSLARETFSDWLEDKAPRLAAALSYYTIFSIAPLLLIVIAIAGAIFGSAATRGAIAAQLQSLVGPAGAEAIQNMIAGARLEGSGLLPTLIGLAMLFLGASGVFAELQDALNTIWEVEPNPGGGILGIIKSRFLSFTMVLGTGFLLLVSLVLSAGLATGGKYLNGLAPGMEAAWHAVDYVVSLGAVTLLFALIYKVLPDVEIAWGDVWPGAFATAVLFNLGKLAIGLYLGHTTLGSAYGPAGALLVVLVWVYYAAQILFLGAEFTQVYAQRYGSRTAPSPNAAR